MKSFIKIALASCLVLGATNVYAANLQDESYFYKISKALRGVAPSAAERSAFEEAASKGQTDQFLQAKIQEFTKTPQFAVKLKQKVDELFYFNTSPNLPGASVAGQASNYDSHFIPQSAYDNLVMSVASNNRSWDQLLVGKTYQVSTEDNSSDNESNFYQIALTDTSTPQSLLKSSLITSNSTYDPSTWKSIVFPEGDLRVAGTITTPRFFGRFANTALNKNRRRASTVFRIFLCDAMTPAVPTHDAATEAGNLNLAFPDHKNFTEGQIRQQVTQDVHGQLPDCRACHYKLDPMGQTFGFSAASLAPMPAPGALAFHGADNRNVNIPVKGLGELAQRITEQPEYASCQVQHFWNWYVGRDVFVSKTRQQELVQKFDQLGRKPQDFVAYLVTTPEFRAKSENLTEDQLLSRKAVSILQNCVNCHQNEPQSGDMKYWDLTSLPYADTPEFRQYAIDRLDFALDITGDGSKRIMPPPDSMWKLSNDDYQVLRKWILHGAPDFQGTLQVPARGGQ